MPLPTKDQITRAIENPSNILTTQLAGFSTKDGLVGPESYSGGFCIVYPLSNGIKTYALRFWHTEIPGIKDRLLKISNYLSQCQIPYFTEFSYVNNVLKVDLSDGSKQVVDAIKMEWIEGRNLVEYIGSIIESTLLSESEKKVCLQNLAESFKQMMACLHKHDISHGDLQHGNIIILDDGTIKLVDYDSIFVPELAGEKQITSGLAAYQHPNRRNSSRNTTSEDDYFSELIIYLSILAFSEDFNLWEPLSTRNEYSLLFTELDLRNIKSSIKYSHIKKIKNEKINFLLDVLTGYLDNTTTQIFEPLEKILSLENYRTPSESVMLDDDDFLFINKEQRTEIKIKRKFAQQNFNYNKQLARNNYKNN